MWKKSIVSTVAAAVVLAGAVTVSAPAEAGYRTGWGGYGHGYRYYRGGNAGAAVAAGIIGGLALGAIAASSRPADGYGYGYGGYAPAYYGGYGGGYYGPRYYPRRAYYRPAYRRVMYAPRPAYGWSSYDSWGDCRLVRRRIVDRWGYMRVRTVRVCY